MVNFPLPATIVFRGKLYKLSPTKGKRKGLILTRPVTQQSAKK